MAYTLQVRFSATILDGLNVEALSQVYGLIDSTKSFDSVITTFNTWLAALDGCTDGAIIAAAIHLYPALPGGLKATPTTAARVEQTGILNFSTAGSTHRWGMAIPALSNSAGVISGGKIVLTEAGLVDTLEDLLTGGGTASLQWTNANAQALVALLDTLISFRKRNQQLALETYER
jgi:hypothetical protein